MGNRSQLVRLWVTGWENAVLGSGDRRMGVSASRHSSQVSAFAGKTAVPVRRVGGGVPNRQATVAFSSVRRSP